MFRDTTPPSHLANWVMVGDRPDTRRMLPPPPGEDDDCPVKDRTNRHARKFEHRKRRDRRDWDD